MISVSIFISSPGDVATERGSAERVIKQLEIEYGGRVRFEPFFWEHEPMRASASFNDPQSIPLTSKFDIVVCILWSRLGTMLSEKFLRADGSRYPSGTAFEVETAIESYRQNKAPDLLVFRRKEDITLPDDQAKQREKLDQYEKLREFINTWFINKDGSFKAAITEYPTLSIFENTLFKHLSSLVAARLRAASDQEPAGEAITYHKGNPFRGLGFFDFQDGDIFFGRSQAIEDVLDCMRAQAAGGTAFTLVHGASGCGKSSLLRAGVMPMLSRPGVAEGVAYWRRAAMTPGSVAGKGVFAALARCLLEDAALPALAQAGMDEAALATQLATQPVGVISALEDCLRDAAQELQAQERLHKLPPTRLILLVDQLEELYSDEGRFPKADREAFITALGVLAQSGVVWVTATLRNDCLPKLTQDVPKITALLGSRGQHLLSAPSQLDMEMMIRLPAIAAGVLFDDASKTRAKLEARLLADASDAPDGLPMLSFVLEQLYEKAQVKGLRRVVSHAAYDALGGIKGAVKARAEEVFAPFAKKQPDGGDALLDKLARALATVDQNPAVPPLRRIASLDALLKNSALAPLITALQEARLLTADQGAGGQRTVCVSHESLFREWPGLKKAVERNRDFLVNRNRASSAALTWRQKKLSKDYLWLRGGMLADAKMLAASAGDLEEGEKAFVHASIKAANHASILLAVMAIIVALCFAGGIYLNRKQNEDKLKPVIDEQVRQANIRDLKQQLAALTAATEQDESSPRHSRHPNDEVDEGQTEEDYHYDSYADSSAQFDEALAKKEIIRRLRELDPNDAEVFAAGVRAEVLDDIADEDLEKDFTKWRALKLPMAELLHLDAQHKWTQGKKLDAALGWITYLKTPGLEPAAKLRLMPKVAETLVGEKRWTEAGTVLNDWINTQDNGEARLMRANLAMDNEDLDAADADVRKASELKPDLDGLDEIKPRLKLRQSFRKESDKVSAVLATAPGRARPEAWLARVRVLLLTERPESALHDLDQAAKAMGGPSTALDYLRGLCLVRAEKPFPPTLRAVQLTSWNLKDSEFQEDIAHVWPRLLKILAADRLLIKNPNDDDALLDRCRNEYWFAQYHHGLADAETLLKQDAENVEGIEYKALFLSQSRAYEKAILYCREQLQKHPEDQDLHYAFAASLAGTQQYQQAVEAISKAILNSSSPSYYYKKRAEYYRKLNLTAKADADDEKARQLSKSKVP